MASLVRATRRTTTEKTLGWLLAAAAAEFAVLAVTGLFLVFFYRPTAAQAWGDIRGVSHAAHLVDVVRFVHRLTSRVMILTVLAIAAVALMLAVGRSLRSRPPKVTAAAAVGFAVVALFGSFTGLLLPWDQLALWAVTVGTNMMGFLPIIRNSSQVQFVLIGGATVSVHTVRLWFFIHTLVVPAVLVVLGVVAGGRLVRSGDEPDGHTGLGS